MKVKLFFAWYDFWVGWFWDRDDQALYVCLLPCCGLKFWRENDRDGKTKPIDADAVIQFCTFCISKNYVTNSSEHHQIEFQYAERDILLRQKA